MAAKKNLGTENQEPAENFEAMLERLQAIVRTLESGDTPLEESMKQFETGVALAKQCQDRLTQAEQKIELLLRASENEIIAEPFSDGA